ncbi:DUF2279 domain-containing protein [Salibacter halophilus]|uniref:DUF2279 domain-containing protein n=1 Tax=Salibacter halophilus TaxID=1803916 RepID=A0A6N6M966_9FLAO|nr:DUF2279 domain-containing protein [Salibacter halophilus]KAB1065616.1 DUF2279 domain-containing protein [Salibacter halophilus]
MKRGITLLVFFILCSTGFSQLDVEGFYPDSLRKDRLKLSVGTMGAAYGVTMYSLYNLWYKNYDQSSFHFFNDNDQWLQMDKAGHIYSTYRLGSIAFEALRWSGVEYKKSLWYGSAAAFVSVSSIEIFDAYSAKWGFSWGDMAANTAGTALFIAQEYAWQDQRVRIKISYHPTTYAQYRPDALGSNWRSRLTKDYNGQSYWASFNINSFAKTDWIPQWLNIAVGYSGAGMLGGTENPEMYDGQQLPNFSRQRQFYLSFDVDLDRIPVQNHLLKGVLKIVNLIKIPGPALRLQDGRFIVDGFYY